MAKHKVNFTIPERQLGRADVTFAVQEDGEPLGRLKVSNGAIVWVPKNAKYGYRMAWSRLDTLMKRDGQHERR